MTEPNDLSDETRDGLAKVLDKLDQGVPVLSGGGKFGIPAMQDIPNGEHLGMGAFRAEADDGRKITWDAGGAMNRDGDLSWTTVKGDTELLAEWLDYDITEVRKAVRSHLEE